MIRSPHSSPLARRARIVKYLRGTVRLCLERLEERIVPATEVWTGLSGSNYLWSNPLNWSSLSVPQSGDTLVFSSVSATSSSTVDPAFANDTFTLVLDQTWNGYLNLETSLTLTGNSVWASGDINLVGNTLTNAGSLAVDNSRYSLFSNDNYDGGNDSNLGGALINQGTITQLDGELVVYDSVTIDNEAGATYDFGSDGNIGVGSGNCTLSNAGIVEKTGGSGVPYIEPNLNNVGGTLEADNGTLQISCFGGSGGTSTGGTFNAEQGATLDLTGNENVNVFTGSYSGSGQGTVLIGTGSLAIGAAGATFNFPAGLLVWQGGINLAGNTLTNTGFVTVSNPAGSHASLVGNDYYAGKHDYNLGGTLLNHGTIVQQGGGDQDQ